MKNYLHAHYFNVLFLRMVMHMWTALNRVSAALWGVHIGKTCHFLGKTVFRKLPGTTISFGDGCGFNSSHRSNLIGVYTPCMFSTLKHGAKLEVSHGCGFSGTVIGCAKAITLGKNVRCGANTLITDTDWHTDDSRTGDDREVIIGDNVWLGYGVKVLKGVTIGPNSLIGACSVVTRDIPANVVAAGNPCKVIKKIENRDL